MEWGWKNKTLLFNLLNIFSKTLWVFRIIIRLDIHFNFLWNIIFFIPEMNHFVKNIFLWLWLDCDLYDRWFWRVYEKFIQCYEIKLNQKINAPTSFFFSNNNISVSWMVADSRKKGVFNIYSTLVNVKIDLLKLL